MSQTGHIIRGTIILVVCGGLVLWVIWRTIKNADDPARMAFKWVLTALVVGFMYKVVGPIVGQGGYSAAFAGIPLTAVCGLVLAIIWRHHIAGLLANPVASLYDGGNVPPEPRPLYSVAQARQKAGRYTEAVAEIRKQLERFPTDFEGQMLMAQIQAENLNDVVAAELTIQRFCAQPGHAPANITFALYSLADWQLQFGPDREAAQRALEQVVQMLPDTEFARTAAHRIAHLGTTEMLLSPEDRKKYAVPHSLGRFGLMKSTPALAPPEKTPEQQALDYVKHLEAHPQDTEAREKLAILYADHYQRLDLATDQLEEMIQLPNQPGRSVVRWLNLLADLQLRHGGDYDTIRGTLQRIVDLYPNLAAAENARKRIELLKLELKAKQKSEPVKMGTYEQKIGLKRGRI